jgi:serine/threonine-protein kinase
MAAAHERGVIHRDLKPGNLFLQDTGEREPPLVKILDLGIGKLFTGTTPKKGLTVAGTVLGTPSYMSPEQCHGEALDGQSDIYSMGVVLYQLLLGFLPFQHDSPLMILSKHVSEAPVWHRGIAADRGLPGEAEAVVMRALAKNPADRQESMLALQQDVAGILSRLRHGKRYALPSPHAITDRPGRKPTSDGVKVVPYQQVTGSDQEVAALSDGIYWVGRRHGTQLECNAYLRVFRGEAETAILIDPGPPKDLKVVSAKVSAVVGSMAHLDYIFINHQDPDVAGSVATILEMNPRAVVICSENTWRLARHYGYDPKRYMATESVPGGRLAFGAGHVLQLVPTPFCHFRGAVMLYDPKERVLFSGDLFAGTSSDARFTASRKSLKGIQQFHEIYMPCPKAMHRALDAVARLVPAPRIIAPQHGSILTGKPLDAAVEMLRGLKLGVDLLEANERDPEALAIANEILEAYTRVAGRASAKTLLDRYAKDGTFPSILSLEGNQQITGFRVSPRLAIETLLMDMTRSVSTQKAGALMEVLLPIRTRLHR